MAATDNNKIATTSSADIFQIFLEDEDGQNILAISDGTLIQSLQIKIFNISGKPIRLNKIDTIANINYNFAILFRPGTLDKISSINLKDNSDWKMQSQDNTLYFGISSEIFSLRNFVSISITS